MEHEDLLQQSGLDRVPDHWDRRYVKNLDKLSRPTYTVVEELDVWMELPDGTRLCVDIYRPGGSGRRSTAPAPNPGAVAPA